MADTHRARRGFAVRRVRGIRPIGILRDCLGRLRSTMILARAWCNVRRCSAAACYRFVVVLAANSESAMKAQPLLQACNDVWSG